MDEKMKIKLLRKLPQFFTKSEDSGVTDITGAIDESLNTLVNDLNELEKQYVILTATGEWLDIWGSWFGVPREFHEVDEDYSRRIIATALRPKLTIPAIISAAHTSMESYYGVGIDIKDVSVYEPYNNIIAYSDLSQYSGDDRYLDHEYWNRNVIDISLPYGVVPEVKKMVHEMKAAGIKVWYTANLMFPLITGYHDNLKAKNFEQLLMHQLSMAENIDVVNPGDAVDFITYSGDGQYSGDEAYYINLGHWSKAKAFTKIKAQFNPVYMTRSPALGSEVLHLMSNLIEGEPKFLTYSSEGTLSSNYLYYMNRDNWTYSNPDVLYGLGNLDKLLTQNLKSAKVKGAIAKSVNNLQMSDLSTPEVVHIELSPTNVNTSIAVGFKDAGRKLFFSPILSIGDIDIFTHMNNIYQIGEIEVTIN